MSDVLVEPLPEQAEGEAPGIRLYTFICMAAALVLAMPLLARGLGIGALLPALVALLLPLARWRGGGRVLNLCVLWLGAAGHLSVRPVPPSVHVLAFLVPRMP